MGQVRNIKFIVFIILFALTGVLLHLLPANDQKGGSTKKNVPLTRALSSVPGWRMVAFNPLDSKVIEALKLDDYINATYERGSQKVSLYIGYYYSSKKIGAAHDPMVCFPGQGWILSSIQTGSMKLHGPEPHKISFSTMIADKGDQKEFIVYWFQSYDSANANTFSQKVSSFLKSLTGGSQGNAFVRITADLKHQSRTQAQTSINEFIRAFYPLFLKYIRTN